MQEFYSLGVLGIDSNREYKADSMRQITLKIARETRGLTQEELAEVTGFSQPDISRWEKGVRSPTAEQIFVITEALGCDPAELFGVNPNIQAQMQAKRDESALLLERAALLAAEYVESLSAADRKAVTPKKFGKFVACLYAVLMEQQDSGHDPIPPGDTMMRMILSQVGHD